jgi:photosystem II stability/assembly factor-like uncharacterized protein
MRTSFPFFLLTFLLTALASASHSDLKWTNLGPGGGGWIQAMTADPRDPNTVYLGCDVGGFYISRDGGASWKIQNTGLDDYFVETIAVHPRDSRILLLGMEGGIYKSSDGGQSWKAMRNGFPKPDSQRFTAPIGALTFDPAQPTTVYAGIGRPRWNKEGQGRIYKSTDTGETWAICTPQSTLDATAIVSDMEVASNGSYVIAATNKGLIRSEDGGASWQAANGGLPHLDVMELAIAPSQPQTVYCTLRTTARGEDAWNGGVFRSDDGGRTWQSRSVGLGHIVGKSGSASKLSSQYKEIVVHPRDAETVYVGDAAWVSAGIYKTTNGGRNWQRVTEKEQPKSMDYGWITQWGPHAESLTLSPAAPERLWFGTSGHVFSTQNGGTSWQQRYTRQLTDGRWTSNGLEVTCLNDVLPDPHRANRVFLAYMDIGLLRSDDNGQSVRDANKGMKFRGNTFTVAFDPTQPDVMWAGTGEWGNNHGEICRSTDGGTSWQRVGTPETGLPDGQSRSIVVDAASPLGKRTLYATVNGHGIYKSSDGGDSWQALHEGLPEVARRQPRGVLLNPRDSKHLRVALAGNYQNGGIWESRDGGTSWTRLSGNAPLFDIKDFEADPANFDTLYVCQREASVQVQNERRGLPGGLFKSTDGGRTWTQLFKFRFTSSVALDAARPGVLFVATDDHPYHDGNRASGVWQSSDGGKNWKQEVQGLTHWNITALRLGQSRLWAGSHGNGVFVAELK